MSIEIMGSIDLKLNSFVRKERLNNMNNYYKLIIKNYFLAFFRKELKNTYLLIEI